MFLLPREGEKVKPQSHPGHLHPQGQVLHAWWSPQVCPVSSGDSTEHSPCHPEEPCPSPPRPASSSVFICDVHQTQPWGHSDTQQKGARDQEEARDHPAPALELRDCRSLRSLPQASAGPGDKLCMAD
ncbi:hypothetical protein P7K49_012032 [Saguinus oedipus]|uniref:Uncharacterized protein n=1 Tax=Saguinus oedipus TaxID=9490 RepID=A0ABQ9VSZ0_SAGOE|nr:hypothetical protein P7K49_012032 [Saguinus oedipus]